ncbi:MAG: S9 family peptidase, partial [Nitrospirae bacterium]|nr:S9 family peptidase [Fimbriimonadaceae bacterium]
MKSPVSRWRLAAVALILCVSVAGSAQKKPLDHTVYDGWKSIGASALSNDGRWLLYTVSPQEGDGTLLVVSARGSGRHEIERGTSARFTDDGKFVVATVVPAKADLDKA